MSEVKHDGTKQWTDRLPTVDQVRRRAAAVSQPLPTLPLWLTPDLHVMLPLETSYQETCRVLGIA